MVVQKERPAPDRALLRQHYAGRKTACVLLRAGLKFINVTSTVSVVIHSHLSQLKEVVK